MARSSNPVFREQLLTFLGFACVLVSLQVSPVVCKAQHFIPQPSPLLVQVPFHQGYTPQYGGAPYYSAPAGSFRPPLLFYLNFNPFFRSQFLRLGSHFTPLGTTRVADPSQTSSFNLDFNLPNTDDDAKAKLQANPDAQLPNCGVLNIEPGEGASKKSGLLVKLSGRDSDKEVGTILLDSLEYEGPDLTETDFYKYKGYNRIFNSKITYGLETKIKEAPWQVAMFVRGKFHCGASVIGERHILTAAHCVTAYKSNPKLLKLSLGDWDLNSKDDGKNIEGKVKKITTHEEFSFFSLQNDIAVLELEEEIAFNNRIKPICLPPKDLDVEGKPITVTGWGRNERNKLQTKLHKLTAFSVQNNVCADRWSRSGAPKSLISSVTICVDAQFGDSCKGDSGGPATIEYPEGSGTHIQAGIVSFGSGSCTDANLPGVYTRVASFIDWINDKIV